MSAAAASEQKENAASDVLIQQFIKLLRDQDIRMVVFDLDQTACRQHSGGVLIKEKLTDYNNAYAPDFKKLVPILLSEGFHLSICTFTDEHYYTEIGGDERFPKADFIAGDHLINAFLKHNFEKDIYDKFINVGYNPGIHREKIPNNKNYHLDRLLEKFNKVNVNNKLKLSECILFDDTKKNIDDAIGFKAVQVPRTGFKLPIKLQSVRNRK